VIAWRLSTLWHGCWKPAASWELVITNKTTGAAVRTRPWVKAPTGRVFTTRSGEPLDAANVRRDFKAVVKRAGLEPEWTPRELRHSFVSLLSDHGIPLERIALLVGHSSQATTESVYRKQLRPVITEGAEAMDEIFADDDADADALRA
jgi:integrase